MKKLLSILSVALLLFSCGNSAKQSGADDESAMRIDSLSGEWVVSGYKTELIKNISPMKLSHILNGYTGVCIGKAHGDSASVLILINNHEAMTGFIYANKLGKKAGSFAFKSDFESTDAIDLMIEKLGDNNILRLYSYDNAGKAISSDKFEYVIDCKGINNPCGLAALDILLEGKWTLLDAQDKKLSDIEIDSYGNVKGWDKYSFITVATDVAFGGADEITMLTDNNKEATNYVVEYMADKIIGYEAIADDALPISNRGQRVFSLMR